MIEWSSFGFLKNHSISVHAGYAQFLSSINLQIQYNVSSGKYCFFSGSTNEGLFIETLVHFTDSNAKV